MNLLKLLFKLNNSLIFTLKGSFPLKGSVSVFVFAGVSLVVEAGVEPLHVNLFHFAVILEFLL